MRKPLAALVALLALSALFAACGDDDSDSPSGNGEEAASGDTLTKEEFIEQGDAICADFSVASEELPPPESEEEFADFLRQQAALAQDAHDDFAALNPPDDGEEVQQALLDALNSGIEAIEGAATAAEDGDTVTAGDLLSEAEADVEADNEQARAYGFEECGKDTRAADRHRSRTPATGGG